MNTSNIDILENIGIIPVTKIDNTDDIRPIVDALLQANIPTIEIVFRSHVATKALKFIAHQFPQITLCAGTILTVDDVESAHDNGAQILFSPGFNPKIIDYAFKKNIMMIPGVSNPSLIQQATDFGLTTLKFFPAENNGGFKILETYAQIYPNIKFIPTGGIQEQHLTDYAKLPNLCAIGGTWLTHPQFIKNSQFFLISQKARLASFLIQGFQIQYPDFLSNSMIPAKKSQKSALNIHNLLQAVTKPNPFSQTDDVQALIGSIHAKLNNEINDNRFFILRCNHIKRSQFYLKNQGFSFESLPNLTQEHTNRILRFTNNFLDLNCYITDL